MVLFECGDVTALKYSEVVRQPLDFYFFFNHS